MDRVDDPDSRVDILPTALANLRGIVRVGRAQGTGALPLHQLRGQLGRGALPGRHGDNEDGAPGVPNGITGQLVRFAVIGVVSTLVHLGLYLLLRGVAGPLTANLVALLLTAVGNTAANRRYTFSVRGRAGTARSQAQGLLVLGLTLVLTSGALAALGAWAPAAGRVVELVALVLATAVATVLRFVAFRSWIFGASRTGTRAPREVSEPDAEANRGSRLVSVTRSKRWLHPRASGSSYAPGQLISPVTTATDDHLGIEPGGRPER